MKFTDVSNVVIRNIILCLHIIHIRIVTWIEVIYLNLIGIKIGKRPLFIGWCSFFRVTGSEIKIGTDCRFNSSGYSNHIGLNHRCIISTMRKGASVIMGDRVGMSGTSIAAFEKITIGDNVRIGANCVIMDGDFHLSDPRTGAPKPVRICNNVWLGYGVTVMKGVTIGENSIIGINSVVTNDIPANCIAAGNPCKVLNK